MLAWERMVQSIPDWKEILVELQSTGSTYDVIRRKYLKLLSDRTGRNVIAYYSGWLEKPWAEETGINDADKIGFMTAIHDLDPGKGLDLVLHTPGGETAATESMVDYLRKKFGTNIRAIVPQLAMSGGTMIACACSSIVMGKQSSLGPIDPQLGGLAAHGVLEEFKMAYDECKADPAKIPVWQPIIARYEPTLIGECQKAIAWSEEMVRNWLTTGMLKDKENAEETVDRILTGLGNHALTKSHARHLPAETCEELGLVIEHMEEDQKLQDAILSVHHSFAHTLSASDAFKIIENQNGKALVRNAKLFSMPVKV